MPLIYTFNLAGYRPSALPAGDRGRYTLGGFSDATFTAMAVLEAATTQRGRSEDGISSQSGFTRAGRGRLGARCWASPP